MPPLLEVQDVSKSFGGVAANVDISFDVQQGEILGLIGPNGAGKTSLFNSISGDVSPDKGQIRLDGRRISGAGPLACARAGVARTFQVVRSFDSMTVRENVQMALLAARREIWRAWRPVRDQHATEADALLADVALLPEAHRTAGVLAYGDLKRLELAVALAARPRR